VIFSVVGEGNKHILAIANGGEQVSLPSINVGITTYDQMLDAIALLPSGGAPGSPFVMGGYVNAVAADGTATLSLTRRVAKIVVENLSSEDGLVITGLQICQTADRSYLFREGHPEEVNYVDYTAVEASGTTVFYVYPQPAETNKLMLTVSGTINGLEFTQSLPIQPASGDMGSNIQYAVKISADDSIIQLETIEQVVEEWGDGEDITGKIGLPTNVLTEIPDPVFLAYCLSRMPAWDTNHDDILSVVEAAAVTSIYVIGEWSNETYNYTGGEIASLEGIEYFTGLTQLTCVGNQLTALDLSNNTALTYLNCETNQLSTLDVSKNTALADLRCGQNQLTTLDVSANTALTDLYCFSNQLTSLDVSKNTALTLLHCHSNQLTSLDVSKNTALTNLGCDSNQLTSLDVSKNTALTYLTCAVNQLTSLDVSKNTALTLLYCHSNPLTSLDVSKNTALTYLDCAINQLTSLDVSKNTALTYLGCGFNQLTSLDVSKNTALTSLTCSSNQLTSLDVSQNTALTELTCYYNQLTSLDISTNVKLTRFDCFDNPGDGISKFPVKAWFDMNSIPSGMVPEGWAEYDFETAGWDFNGVTITPEYEKVL
jgi:Leucine-rich repeat (LRR) protein